MSGPAETDLPHVLPRGRHAAPQAIVRESQRTRLVGAIAAVVADKGYARTAVADVIEHAGVSRKTFYEHFANKEECFLAAYDAGVDLLLAALEDAVLAATNDPLAAARAGTRSYLEALAARPDFARTFLIEVLGAGPVALQRRTAVHERFADRLAANHAALRRAAPEIPALPRYVFTAGVGAIHEMVTSHLLRHGAASLPELLEPIMLVQIAALVGHGPAQDLVAGRTVLG